MNLEQHGNLHALTEKIAGDLNIFVIFLLYFAFAKVHSYNLSVELLMAMPYVFIVKKLFSAIEHLFFLYTILFLSARKSLLMEILFPHNNLHSGCFWSLSKRRLSNLIAAQKDFSSRF